MRVLLLGEVHLGTASGVDLVDTADGPEFNFNDLPGHQSEHIGIDGASTPLETDEVLALMRKE